MTLETTIQKDWAWFTQHLILIIVLGVSVTGAVYFVDNQIAKHDVATASKYEQILNSQIANTKTLQQELASLEADNAKRDAAYEKTIMQLSQTIIQRDVNAKKQQTVDASLDAAAAAQRILLQTKAAAPEVTVAGNSVVLDLPVARIVVSDLDTLPVVQADLADTKSQLISQKNLTTDAQQEASAAKDVIASQTVQLVDANKVCDGKIAVLKASARKSKFRWFIGGAITVGVFIALHAAGL